MKTRPARRLAVAALVAAMAMVATISPAAAFTDVKTNHPFYTEITWASNEGIVNGYPDQTFRGGNQVTRQAASAFLFRFAAIPTYTPPASATFSDVPTDYAFFKEIEWMVAAEITTGYAGGIFKPGAPVTRQAMAAFFWRIAGAPTPNGNPPQIFNDVPKSHPFFVATLWVWDYYIADGYATPYGWIFKPSGVVSRQAAAAFIYRADQVFEDTSVAEASDASGAGELEWAPGTPSELVQH
jgi:hypothetical protein